MKLIIALLTFQTLLCFAQPTFQRTIGGTGNDAAKNMAKTTDGGFIIAGETSSYGQGNSDMYIVKLDAAGSVVWTQTVGGSLMDGAAGIIQTSDGGYAAAGYTNSFGLGGYDMYIVKFSPAGAVLWSKAIGEYTNEQASSICQTSDGGYILTGWTNSFGAGNNDMYIVKLDAVGDLIWSRTIGGTNVDQANSITETSDGKYIIAGLTISYGAGVRDMFAVKLNGNGSMVWSKTFGGTSTDNSFSIIQTMDGGYALAGVSFLGGGGGVNYSLIKMDTSGTMLWAKSIRTETSTVVELVFSLIQSADSGFVMAGFKYSPIDMYIVKLDNNGSLLWSRIIGGSGSDTARTIVQTTDGGYAIAGGTNSFGAGGSDIFFIKLDTGGNACGNFILPNTIVASETPTTTSPTPTITTPTTYIATPPALVQSGGIQTPVCNVVGTEPISNEIPNSFNLYQNYPNPFNPVTNFKFQIADHSANSGLVKLVVYNALGAEVETLINKHLEAGTYETTWDASAQPSGVYFYRLQITNSSAKSGLQIVFQETRKMLLLK